LVVVKVPGQQANRSSPRGLTFVDAFATEATIPSHLTHAPRTCDVR
jgi:hypothetical protein